MIREETTFKSIGGDTLDLRFWRPDGAPKAVVQIIHGMAEHIDRYGETASFLADRGMLVIGHTHAGHGPRAKTPGYFGPKDGWQRLVEDAWRIREQYQPLYPEIPWFLLGHSMGSFVTRCLLMDHPRDLSGAVLSGTGYFSPGQVGAGRFLASCLCALGRREKPSPLINQMGFATANRPFTPARTDFDWLSRDEKRVDAYVADPYCGHLFTAGGYRDLFDGLRRLDDLKALSSMPKDLPVLFISGGCDPIGGMGDGVRRIEKQFRDAGLSDVTLKLYDGARHELFNEINREEVWSDVAAWLQKRIEASFS